MTWVNSPTRFGLVSRLIHWAMAALILGMLLLGTRLGAMQPGLANLWLYGLHKTGGFVALSLVVLRVIWHRISPPCPAGFACGLGQSCGQLGSLRNLCPADCHSAVGLNCQFRDRHRHSVRGTLDHPADCAAVRGDRPLGTRSARRSDQAANGDAGPACAGGAAARLVARWHDDAHAARLTAQCDR
ncbi:MAG: cytochrome b/b6 domain-containing protein, partial [Pseudorhodobacter sp.]|nr:cytochrome b/b6 domain-containing protein [Pseudorhodobacter sp.]